MKVKILSETARMPTYATDGSACFDLYADCSVVVKAKSAETIKTGIAVEVPNNHVLLIFSRSGHGFNHGIRLANCVGVVDVDYVGEIFVRIHNDSNVDYSIGIGERIAQASPFPTFRHTLELVEELRDTKRGSNGIGSSGKY